MKYILLITLLLGCLTYESDIVIKKLGIMSIEREIVDNGIFKDVDYYYIYVRFLRGIKLIKVRCDKTVIYETYNETPKIIYDYDNNYKIDRTGKRINNGIPGEWDRKVTIIIPVGTIVEKYEM